MPNEWKVGAATEGELEKHLQDLDCDGFEVHGIFPVQESMKTRFVIVGRRELPQGRRRRHYQARAVSLRCSNGRFVRWVGLAQPLRADAHHAGSQETFLMAGLEERYGEKVFVFRASSDSWVSMPNETFTGPVTLFSPDVGAWQMFSVLPKTDGRFVLRTSRLRDGSHKFLGLDEQGRLEARPATIETAESFSLEPISGRKGEEIAVTLHF